MSKINIFALGGLNENGKNMYVVEVDETSFIFDAGLKYPGDNYYGIDYIIPSYNYIRNNIKKIQGIFLSHGHDENVGAICDIVTEFPSIKIYGTKLTVALVKKELEEYKIKYNNFEIIECHQKITFENINPTIFPIQMTHTIPDAVGYSLVTKEGSIFYTGDYTFDWSTSSLYQTDINKLCYMGKQGVLCVLGDSTYAGKEGHTSPNHRLDKFIRNILVKSDKRVVFNILSNQIYRIQEIFNEVSLTNRKIVIVGKRLQSIIFDCIDTGYLHIDKKYIGDLNDLALYNSVLLICNEREKPFVNIERIALGYDKLVKLKEGDTAVFLFPPYESTEKLAVKVADELEQHGINVVTLSKKEHLSMHPSKEDIKMLLSILKPKYYFPVKGEYRYQVMNADCALEMGMNPDNIFLKQNGDVVTFVNGNVTDDKIKQDVDDILIDGKASNDIGQLVLKDRELLSNNGIVIIAVTLDRKSKEILIGPEITTKGFLYIKNNLELVANIKEVALNIVESNKTPKYIDYSKIRSDVREQIGKMIFKETESKPMIISVIQEI